MGIKEEKVKETVQRGCAKISADMKKECEANSESNCYNTAKTAFIDCSGENDKKYFVNESRSQVETLLDLKAECDTDATNFTSEGVTNCSKSDIWEKCLKLEPHKYNETFITKLKTLKDSGKETEMELKNEIEFELCVPTSDMDIQKVTAALPKIKEKVKTVTANDCNCKAPSNNGTGANEKTCTMCNSK